MASARHLGNQHSWNGRNGSELTQRFRAAQRAGARWRASGRQRGGGAFDARPFSVCVGGSDDIESRNA